MNNYAIYKLAFATIKITYEKDVILSIKKIDEFIDLGYPTPLTDLVYQQLLEYIKGIRKEFDFTYELRGTPFQLKVWNALLTIPYGETRTYKDIAIAVHNNKASRAIGSANHCNPMWIVVPCHRVIGSNQKMIGYAGGIEMKRQLLEIEKNKN